MMSLNGIIVDVPILVDDKQHYVQYGPTVVFGVLRIQLPHSHHDADVFELLNF